MAKVDPREATGRPGPVRTESGTRARVRVAPVAPEVTAQPGANDVQPEREERYVRPEMPTRELDLDSIRALALRCASDVGAEAKVSPPAPAPEAKPKPSPKPSPKRARLELVLTEEADETPAPRPGRSWGRTLGLLVVVLALATGALAALQALQTYGILP
jgi:hypothetical protein